MRQVGCWISVDGVGLHSVFNGSNCIVMRPNVSTLLETLHLVSNETLNRNTSRHFSVLKSSHHHLELAASQAHGRRFYRNLDVQLVYGIP